MDETLTLVKDEHKVQGEKIRLLDNLFKDARKALDVDLLNRLREEIRQVSQELKEHFYIEESKLFPNIINENNELLIKNLEKEHIELLELAKTLDKNIQDIMDGKNKWAELRYNLSEFLHTLNDHILKEDYQLLVSLK